MGSQTTLRKQLEVIFNGNYTEMLRAVLDVSSYKCPIVWKPEKSN